MTAQRLLASDRKKQLLDAALFLAAKHGYMTVIAQMVADRAKCSRPLVVTHLGRKDKMQSTILAEAIKRRDLKVIAQGLAMGDRRCLKLPAEVIATARASN